jgi:hypothetical protein
LRYLTLQLLTRGAVGVALHRVGVDALRSADPADPADHVIGGLGGSDCGGWGLTGLPSQTAGGSGVGVLDRRNMVLVFGELSGGRGPMFALGGVQQGLAWWTAAS